MADTRRPRENEATPSAAEELRVQAAERVDGLTAASASPAPADAVAAVQELRAHQIELEMQNEELRRGQHELDAQREKYFDLFDLAPVGYLTLSDQGIVGDANLAAAHLLGVERLLPGQPFSTFVLPSDRDVYYQYQRLLQQTGEPQTCELRLHRVGKTAPSHFWARLEGRPQRVADGDTLSTWMTFTDTEERQQAEEALRESERWLGESQRIARLGNYTYDIENDRWSGSPSLYHVLGTDESHAGDFAGWLELVHPADRERMSRYFLEDVLGKRRPTDKYNYDIDEDRWAGSPSLHLAPGTDENHSSDLAGWPEIVHPADRERMSRYFLEDVLGKRRPFDMEYRIVRPRDGVERWVRGLGSVEFREDGQPVAMFGVIQDVTERRVADEALRDSEQRQRLLFDSLSEGFAVHEIVVDEGGDPCDYRFLQVNHAFEEMTGLVASEIVGRSVLEVLPGTERMWIERYGKVALTGESAHFESYASALDKYYEVQAYSPEPGRFATVVSDITERKQAEAYGQMGREILQILNEPGNLHYSIQRVLATLKTSTGFDAVGIRLQDGDDFPYFAQSGFSDDFLLTESTLVERAVDGGICRDKDGNVSLECTCGLVCSGKTDPTNPLFTAGGSAWTNDSPTLLDISPEEDPRLHPRNRCIHQGYASVALVPIRNKDRIVGLIQLNDRREGRFALGTVERLEEIASHIGEAMMRKQAEDALRESEAKLKKAQHYAHVGSWTWNIGTNQLEWSDEMFRLFGIEQATFSGSLPDVIARSIHPDDRHKVEQSNLSIINGAQPIPVEYRVIWPDRSVHVVWAEAGELLLDERGDPSLLSGTVLDVTERRQAEAALLESETRYRQLFEQMLEGFAYCRMIYDSQGRPVDFEYLEVNDAFGRLTGLTDVVGKRATVAIPGIEDSNPELFEIYGAVAMTGEPTEFDIHVGVLELWLHVSAFRPLPDHFVAVFTNITGVQHA